MSIKNRTITRRMNSSFNGLKAEFKSLCLLRREDFEVQLEALKKSWNKSDRHSKLKRLFDMFDAYGIKYERGRDFGYYENLVKKSNISEFKSAEDRMLYALYKQYMKYPSPDEYMKRTVDRLCTKEDGWERDTLRVRILKQFIKYGNFLKDADIKGKSLVLQYAEEKAGRAVEENEVISFVDDEIFGLLNVESEKINKDGLEPEEIKRLRSRAKERVKAVRKNSELLKIADDLAQGKFRVEGATKKYLYLFAMVYNMTYYDGRDFKIINYDSDIEINLFRDYYSNNLLRFVSEIYDGRGKAMYETDPSGQGINYKNFAEMVYLYYIVKNCSPEEKIKQSNAMIKRIQKKCLKKGKPETKEQGGTQAYRDYFKGGETDGGLFAEDILSLPEKDFEEFLCEKYNCDTYDGSYKDNKGKTIDLKSGVFSVENEQESAFREYRAVLKKLVKEIILIDYDYSILNVRTSSIWKRLYDRVCIGVAKEVKAFEENDGAFEKNKAVKITEEEVQKIKNIFSADDLLDYIKNYIVGSGECEKKENSL
ncbi:MAG: hypothetical protein LUG66_01535 [Clostridiales bacterium]|nr:hypothetical protein [Clostridiales bacterium]